jgi:hypothetical protein
MSPLERANGPVAQVTGPFATLGGMDEPAASQKTRTRAQTDDQVLRRTTTSGAKGFAIVFGAMVGIIGALWLIATLVSPH